MYYAFNRDSRVGQYNFSPIKPFKYWIFRPAEVQSSWQVWLVAAVALAPERKPIFQINALRLNRLYFYYMSKK